MAKKNRILIIDALRGFALLGIILIHCVEHFEIFQPTDPCSPFVLGADDDVFDTVIFLVGGKAYSIFALLFGYSFFIQIHSQEIKGVDFRRTFLWRLAVLFGIGLLHSLVYRGDILHIYALMGIPLIALYTVKSRTLLILAGVCVLQVPLLVLLVESFYDPSYVYTPYYGDGYFERGESLYTTGSFWNVVRFNLYEARVVVWTWTYHTGRFFQLMALFLVGLVIARERYLENLKAKRHQVAFIGYFCLIMMLLSKLYQEAITTFQWTEAQAILVTTVVQSYLNLLYTVAICCGFILSYVYLSKYIKVFTYMASYGRMSLTNYMLQAIVGVLIFYGFGLGWWDDLGATWSLGVGAGLFLVQLWFSQQWLRYYRYGPMEWFWRALTYRDFSIPIRKNDR
ncbi:uncharacterized protein SAMN04488028_10258 [Reichenbachiella agariperforans]|uniref:Uncharacterized protein n=1 Tax=Reichenbachiella agariperforans TaxID=156994 RepID=A0A1M6N1P6_REIAG|nr:DUF418 domain-containing protein [Reichenbachiella agariperforans]SHJ89614.1 uncharacterized protein SAMN04488028_10258 [Reichenbachiella agariperforans]